MTALAAIAANTFREAVRDRVLYLILFFAVLIILGSEALAVLAVGSPEKVVLDLGLAAISFFGVLISVFLALSLVAKEIDRRTVYTVVTKPISRGHFVSGKLAGMYAVVVLVTAAMTALFLGFVWLRYGIWNAGLLKAVSLFLVEDLVVSSFALLFSSFTTPILGTVFTITVYVVGHLLQGLKMLAAFPSLAGSTLEKVLTFLYDWVLPNLERFNVKGAAVYGDPLPLSLLLSSAAYGAAYAAAVLGLAVTIFSRRDFT